jgi:hypothetical protein
MSERILPKFDKITAKNLEEIIDQGIGAASVCWESMDETGQFESERASQIANEVIGAAYQYAKQFIGQVGPQEKARQIVFHHVKSRLEKTDTHVTFAPDEVYIVWFAKTLQNWKALVSTTLPDGMYYEVTYNGDKAEAYLDAYKKFDNICVPD